MLDVKEINKTSDGAPSQWDLTLTNGTNYHVHFRNGRLTIWQNDMKIYQSVIRDNMKNRNWDYMDQKEMLTRLEGVLNNEQ